MKLLLFIAGIVLVASIAAWLDIAFDGVMVAEDIAWCDKKPCE